MRNGFLISSLEYYPNLKLIGKVKFTGTALPACSPGVHFGIAFTTRFASVSSASETPLQFSRFE